MTLSSTELDEGMYPNFEPIFRWDCGSLQRTILNNAGKTKQKYTNLVNISRETNENYKSAVLKNCFSKFYKFSYHKKLIGNENSPKFILNYAKNTDENT